jgi:hypothetical protein
MEKALVMLQKLQMHRDIKFVGSTKSSSLLNYQHVGLFGEKNIFRP